MVENRYFFAFFDLYFLGRLNNGGMKLNSLYQKLRLGISYIWFYNILILRFKRFVRGVRVSYAIPHLFLYEARLGADRCRLGIAT